MLISMDSISAQKQTDFRYCGTINSNVNGLLHKIIS